MPTAAYACGSALTPLVLLSSGVTGAVDASVDVSRSSSSSASHTQTSHLDSQSDLQRAHNDYVRAVADLTRARGDYGLKIRQGQKLLAEARLTEQRRIILEAALAQAVRDFRLINSVVDTQAGRIGTLVKHHKVASRIREDGVMDQARVRALKKFFTAGAIGKTRRSLLGDAMRTLLTDEPVTYAGILDGNGGIVSLDADNFLVRESKLTRETYIVKMPVKPPATAAWELHITTPREARFSRKMTIRTIDADGLPGNLVREEYVRQFWRKDQQKLKGRTIGRVTYYQDPPPTFEKVQHLSAVLKPHLEDKLWVRFEGGGEYWLTPEFYFVETDATGLRTQTAADGIGPAPKQWLEEGVTEPKEFEGGTVMDLVRFAFFNGFNIQGDALDILDASIATVEANARAQILASVEETQKFRKSFAELEIEIAKALGVANVAKD